MTTSSFVPGTAAGASHKLWGGRFKGVMSAPEFDALNNSIGVDFRLWPYDVELSKAWAMALYGAGVLALDGLEEFAGAGGGGSRWGGVGALGFAGADEGFGDGL